MPKKWKSIKFDADNSNLNSYIEPSPPIYYSLFREKVNNEKKIIELEVQLNLTIKLLSEVKDTKQRSKLEVKKKNCLEKKESLKATINEISDVYRFFYKSRQIYQFVEDFYNLFVELFKTDNDVDSLFIKKLEELQSKERQLIESVECVLDLKAVLPDLNDHKNVENFIDNFFNKIEATCKNTPSNGFFYYILLCEKLFEMHNGPLESLEIGVFNLKSLGDFFRAQTINFPLPSTSHSLVGIVVILIYKTLFNFLKCQPIEANFKKLNVYIKFHIDISNATMDKFILHELYSMQKKMNSLKNTLKELPKTKTAVSKCTIGESLKSIEVGCQELTSIKLFLNNIFKNKLYLYSLNLLNSVFKKSANELIAFMQERIGLDNSLVHGKKNIYTLKSNKMFINYFFSSISVSSVREEVRKTVEYFFVLVAKQTVESPSVDLVKLTNKDLLNLSYLAYSLQVIFEFQTELDRLSDNLKNSKLSMLDISLEISLDQLKIDIKNLEEKENFFFKKKFMSKTKFSECKKKLVDEFEFLLYSLGSIVSQAEEIKDLSLCSQSDYFQKFSDYWPKQILYLIDIKNKFSVRRDEVKKYFLSENCNRITEVKNGSSGKYKVDIKEKLINLESLFEPMACIVKDLNVVAEYIEQPERIIIKWNKDARKKNGFLSALGRIRASVNLVSQAVYEFENNRIACPNLINSLESIKQVIEIATVDNDKRLILFERNIETCLLLVERIHQEIMAVTSKCGSYNNELAQLLENDIFESPIASKFFCGNSKLKKISTILTEKYNNLFQKIDWLRSVINAIGGKEICVIRKFYRVLSQADEYEKIYNCIRQQIDILTVYSHSFPIRIDKKTQLLDKKNFKQSFKNKKKRAQKKLTPSSEDPSLESSICRLVELRKFSKWSAEFEDWKQKRYSYLDNVFNTIEKCSFAHLNKTANGFFKILDCYDNELCFKQQELKEQSSQVGNFFQGSEICGEPIKNFMVYSDQWCANVLARLRACKDYLLQSCETYNVLTDNNFARNACGMAYFPPSKESSELLTEYLKYCLIYNKNKIILLVEEKKLAAINEEFVEKILKKSSLSEIEQEANLLSQFNEQLSEVNRLNSTIKEAQEKRQIVKEELARLVKDPKSLNLYLRRIDPSDTPIEENYVLSPSSFYFFSGDAASASLADSANCEPSIAYYPDLYINFPQP